jgi:hypothetical protein
MHARLSRKAEVLKPQALLITGTPLSSFFSLSLASSNYRLHIGIAEKYSKGKKINAKMHGGMKKLTLKGQCNESSKLNPETNQFLPFPWEPDFSPLRIFKIYGLCT